MSQRSMFLDTIRRQLAIDTGPRETTLPPIVRRRMSHTDAVAQFQTQAQSAGAHCDIIVRPEQIGDTLCQVLRDRSVRRVAVSDSNIVVASMPRLSSEVAVVRPEANRDTLFQAEAGITSAQWGLAETGTLVLESSVERNRLASLVPPIHIALLPISRILPTMDELFRRLPPAKSNQAVTFITGPSRTADIELTLVVGVHGPKDVNIILIQDTHG